MRITVNIYQIDRLIYNKDMELKFNLNEKVRFRPTDIGLHHIVKQHNNIMPTNMYTCFKLEKDKLDSEGYLTWQGHTFIDMFGGLGMSLDLYIDIEIYLTK